MHRILAVIGIATLASACSYMPTLPGPSTAYYANAPAPDCQATPGNSLAGFRCTGSTQ